MLLEKYQLKNGSGLVNYRDFVNSLDRVFSDEVDTTEVIQNAKTSAVSYKNQICLDSQRLSGPPQIQIGI